MATVQEFAAKIKTKYPQYQGINDSILTQRIIEKYPQYKNQVDFEQQSTGPAPSLAPAFKPSELKFEEGKLIRKMPEMAKTEELASVVQHGPQEPKQISTLARMEETPQFNLLQAQEAKKALFPSQTKAQMEGAEQRPLGFLPSREDIGTLTDIASLPGRAYEATLRGPGESFREVLGRTEADPDAGTLKSLRQEVLRGSETIPTLAVGGPAAKAGMSLAKSISKPILRKVVGGTAAATGEGVLSAGIGQAQKLAETGEIEPVEAVAEIGGSGIFGAAGPLATKAAGKVKRGIKETIGTFTGANQEALERAAQPGGVKELKKVAQVPEVGAIQPQQELAGELQETLIKSDELLPEVKRAEQILPGLPEAKVKGVVKAQGKQTKAAIDFFEDFLGEERLTKDADPSLKKVKETLDILKEKVGDSETITAEEANKFKKAYQKVVKDHYGKGSEDTPEYFNALKGAARSLRMSIEEAAEKSDNIEYKEIMKKLAEKLDAMSKIKKRFLGKDAKAANEKARKVIQNITNDAKLEGIQELQVLDDLVGTNFAERAKDIGYSKMLRIGSEGMPLFPLTTTGKIVFPAAIGATIGGSIKTDQEVVGTFALLGLLMSSPKLAVQAFKAMNKATPILKKKEVGQAARLVGRKQTEKEQ